MTAQLPRISAILVFATVASTAGAQNRLLVPGQFAQIGAAVQAATPGTIIEVMWQVQPYLPFVIDRPVTIVGRAGENMAPMVEVSQGVGIDFQLTTGDLATVSRIDVRPALGATLIEAVRIQGGHVTLEDCRFRGGRDLLGTAGLATVEIVDAEVTMAFTWIEGGRGVDGMRAIRSRIDATKCRFFGASNLAGEAVQLDDSTFHGSGAWLLGGEDFLGGPGAVGLRATGTTRAFLVDCAVAGGMGQPGGIGLVNTTTTPIELLRSAPGGGFNLNSNTNATASVGPTVANPNLLGLVWSEPPYRRGTLQPGVLWGVHAIAAPGTWVFLLASFAPTATATTWTRQPAMLPQDVAFAIPVVASTFGYASHISTLPNVPALKGVGLWVQAMAGTAFPLEATPLSGVVVR